MDGKFVLFSQQDGPRGESKMWVLPLGGDSKPYPFGQASFAKGSARFSPDGRWIAFRSNETGAAEVYVTRFDHPGERFRISRNGGSSAHWRRDGKELFFLAADNTVMSVMIKPGDSFDSGKPTALFRNESIVSDDDAFDLKADGQQFIAVSRTTQTRTMPIAVVVNWTADLKH